MTERKRPFRIHIRLCLEELQSLKDASEYACLSIPDYCRRQALKAAGKPVSGRPKKARTETIQSLQRLLGALGAVGNNINQIAYHCNSSRSPASESQLSEIRGDLAETLSEIRTILKEV